MKKRDDRASRDEDVEIVLRHLQKCVDALAELPPEGWYPLQVQIAACLNRVATFAGLRTSDGTPNLDVPLGDDEVVSIIKPDSSIFQLLKDAAAAQLKKVADLLPRAGRREPDRPARRAGRARRRGTAPAKRRA